MGLALGFDGARYAAKGLLALTERLDPFGVVQPALARARESLRSATGDNDVSRLLGFDPLAVLRALLKR